jgi:DNA-directed RNA polymerase subunit D
MLFYDYVESGPTLLGDKTRKIRGTFRFGSTESPANTTLANVLRREILVSVPTVGFRTEPVEKTQVVIDTNTTPLMNEMLAHRIGMIPIRADPDMFDPDRYEFVINKENDGKTMVDITASDFEVYERDPADPLAEGRRVDTATFFPPDPITGSTCLITRLRPQWNPTAKNEALSLKARASISTGAENIRWSPVSQCSFENSIDTDATRQEEMFTKWLNDHKKISNPSDPAYVNRIPELRREYDTMEYQRCFLVNETGEPYDFKFYIESIGAHSVSYCVMQGIKAAIKRLTKYQDLDNDLPATVSLRPGDARFPCIDFIFENEEHTLGNLLQQYLVDHHVEGNKEPKISYAGYKVPHPLKAEMVLRVGVDVEGLTDPEEQTMVARRAVANVCRGVKSVFDAMLEQWSVLTAQFTGSLAAPPAEFTHQEREPPVVTQ